MAADRGFRALMLRVLHDHRVALASTPLEARALLDASTYRLVIVTNLGIRPHDAVSIIPPDHGYPVIFISGFSTHALRRECALKRIRWMNAPCSLKDLRDAVTRALSK